jgi:hypothetical protein
MKEMKGYFLLLFFLLPASLAGWQSQDFVLFFCFAKKKRTQKKTALAKKSRRIFSSFSKTKRSGAFSL